MTAPEKPKRGSTATILTAALILLLVAFLGVPGYIAAFYCNVTHDRDSEFAIIFYNFPTAPHMRPRLGLRIFLAPAWYTSEVAPPLRDFYLRQFQAVIRPAP